MKLYFLLFLFSTKLIAEVSFDDVYYESKEEERRTFSFLVNYGAASFNGMVGESNPFGEAGLSLETNPQTIGASFYSSFAGLQGVGLTAAVEHYWSSQINEFYYTTDLEDSRTDNTGGAKNGIRKMQATSFTLGLRLELNSGGASTFVPFIGGGFGGAIYRDSITRGDGAAGPQVKQSTKPWEKGIGYGEAGLQIGFLGLFNSTSQAKEGFFGYKNGENAGLVFKVGYQNDFSGGGYDLSGLYYSLGLSIRTDS